MGIRESAKALDKRRALPCILAENCDEPMYKKLATALCMEHGIPLIKVDSNMKLGNGLASARSTRRAKLGRWSNARQQSSETGARRLLPTMFSKSTSSLPSDLTSIFFGSSSVVLTCFVNLDNLPINAELSF